MHPRKTSQFDKCTRSSTIINSSFESTTTRCLESMGFFPPISTQPISPFPPPQLGCPRKLGSMVSKLVIYNLLVKWGIPSCWYNPLILTSWHLQATQSRSSHETTSGLLSSDRFAWEKGRSSLTNKLKAWNPPRHVGRPLPLGWRPPRFPRVLTGLPKERKGDDDTGFQDVHFSGGAMFLKLPGEVHWWHGSFSGII